MVPSDSRTSSSSVATLSVAVLCLALKVTDDAGVPLRTLPVWVTFIRTFSAAVGAGFAVIVKVASVPSVTGEVPAEIVTSGRGSFTPGASLSLTLTVADDGEPAV